LLDGIQDPRNLGAIIRSASCAAVNGVIVPQKGSAPLDGVAIKSSAGLVEYMPIYQPTSSAVAIQEVQQAGYAIYLATCDGADIRSVEFKSPLCLVIGSEGSGISSSLLKKGQRITIPQRANDISYNASVAAGIIFFFASSAFKKI
jgi:23S rRNA (guanosine2251-2'-O)-methyltransferase